MTKHTILFLAANSYQTAQLAPDREARAIHDELQRSGHRDCFEFITRWAADSRDLLSEHRKRNPTVMHLSGPCDPQHGLLLPSSDGQLRHVSGEALKETFEAVGASVQLVVLSGCYSEALAQTLAEHVDCVVGMRSTITDEAAREFAAGFYGALGDGWSVSAAFHQGCAAIKLRGLSDNDKPQLITRPGVNPEQIVLASAIGQTSLDSPGHSNFENPDVPEDADFLASVVFVHLEGLKDCLDGPRIHNALAVLSDALREVDSSAFVLSTLTGAIIVIPDGASWSVDATLAALARSRGVGFALRVGVTHGMVDAVTDIDGQRNLVGPPINIAARLATSPDNPGSLIHESYAQFVEPTLAETHWLHCSRRRLRTVTGKPQDPPFTCFAAPYHFDATDARPAASSEPPAWRAAALIAYDLPGFSAGDRAQLRKRFTLLGRVFRRLRQRNPSAQASALLSPGGDGGVLVFDGVSPAQAAVIASELRKSTEIESCDHADPIAVRLRVGVHYGQVTSYRNARGLTRPTGLEVFVADEIASDEHARRSPGVILTKRVADSVAGGSAEQLRLKFEPLPARRHGHTANVERYRTLPDPERRLDEDAHPLEISGPEGELERRFRFTGIGIPIGLAAGGGVGICVYEWAPDVLKESLLQIGHWFPVLIQALLAPLLVGAVIRGVATGTGSLVSFRPILRFLGKVAVWFLFSTIAASAIGLAAAKVIPKEGMTCFRGANQGTVDTAATIAHCFPMVFVFSALFGLAIPLVGPKAKPVMQVIDSIEAVAFKMASFVPYIVPFAALVSFAAYIGKYGFGGLIQMVWYAALACGALIAYVAFLLVAMRSLTRIRLRTFLSALFQPAMIAFATRTSGAAMPLTMQVLARLGIPRNIVDFVVPTGGLFNLAGSTLYVMFGVMYANQCNGLYQSFSDYLTIMFSLICSWKIAGVPGGAFSVIREKAPLDFIGALAAIDVFLDMLRTCVNVIGNSVAAVVVAAWEGRTGLPRAQLRSPRK